MEQIDSNRVNIAIGMDLIVFAWAEVMLLIVSIIFESNKSPFSKGMDCRTMPESCDDNASCDVSGVFYGGNLGLVLTVLII